MLLLYVVMFCFFFKQKTAYEMRISDWSSDLCSSDLSRGDTTQAAARAAPLQALNVELMTIPPRFPPCFDSGCDHSNCGPIARIAAAPPKIGSAMCRERVLQYG